MQVRAACAGCCRLACPASESHCLKPLCPTFGDNSRCVTCGVCFETRVAEEEDVSTGESVEWTAVDHHLHVNETNSGW